MDEGRFGKGMFVSLMVKGLVERGAASFSIEER
jgi:hypothetical protein